jgi:small conductance mechanosensitive channel
VAAFVATKVVARVVRLFGARVRRTLEEHGGETRVDREKRVATLSRILRLTVSIAIWVVALMMSLKEVGYDVGPLIAGAGVVGLAIGFGAQNLVRDVITGLFMLLENQVLVGDDAVINGQAGSVEEVNLRTIVLRDGEGTVHTFPNGAITALANKTRDYSYHLFKIGVSYKEDTDRVTDLIRRVSTEMKNDPEFGPLMLSEFDIWGVDSFGPSGVIINGRVKTKVGQQWKVGREANRRIKKLFETEGVGIPYPQMALSAGEASQNLPLSLSENSAEIIRKIVREELALRDEKVRLSSNKST